MDPEMLTTMHLHSWIAILLIDLAVKVASHLSSWPGTWKNVHFAISTSKTHCSYAWPGIAYELTSSCDCEHTQTRPDACETQSDSNELKLILVNYNWFLLTQTDSYEFKSVPANSNWFLWTQTDSCELTTSNKQIGTTTFLRWMCSCLITLSRRFRVYILFLGRACVFELKPRLS